MENHLRSSGQAGLAQKSGFEVISCAESGFFCSKGYWAEVKLPKQCRVTIWADLNRYKKKPMSTGT